MTKSLQCGVHTGLLVSLVVCSALSQAVESQNEAQVWLERMTQAAQQLDYDGTFVYRNGSEMESMRIIHKNDESGERSRLIALSGAKREVLRDSSQVVCILPDDEAVVVAKRRPPNPYHTAILTASKDFAQYYDVSVMGGDRVAGRQTEVLVLTPLDKYRYGYHLWVDRETGLLLKSDLLSAQGGALEQFIYTSISLPAEITDDLLEPGITGQQLTWHINGSGALETVVGEAVQSPWQVDWLPDGFMMADCTETDSQSGDMPVTHMVYTDGLASLSVFIEQLNNEDPLEGLSAMGAMNAFGRIVDGHQVTVVGEVPTSTVEAVANSVNLIQ